MEDVLSHPWMNGECPTAAEVYTDLQQRMAAYKESMENEREQKDHEKEKREKRRRERAVGAVRGEGNSDDVQI